MGSPSTRERIVAEARRLFAEKGFDGATTAEIARRARVAEGTIYRHFQDKKELFIACVMPAVRAGMEQGVAAAQGAGDLRGVVRAMLEARWHLLRENPESFRILFTEAPHHPELAELFIDRFVVERSQLFAPLFSRLLGESRVQRPPNLLILGLGLTVAMWALLTFGDRAAGALAAARLPLPVGSPETLLDDLTEFVLYGLAGQPTGGEA